MKGDTRPVDFEKCIRVSTVLVNCHRNQCETNTRKWPLCNCFLTAFHLYCIECVGGRGKYILRNWVLNQMCLPVVGSEGSFGRFVAVADFNFCKNKGSTRC